MPAFGYIVSRNKLQFLFNSFKMAHRVTADCILIATTVANNLSHVYDNENNDYKLAIE